MRELLEELFEGRLIEYVFSSEQHTITKEEWNVVSAISGIVLGQLFVITNKNNVLNSFIVNIDADTMNMNVVYRSTGTLDKQRLINCWSSEDLQRDLLDSMGIYNELS